MGGMMIMKNIKVHHIFLAIIAALVSLLGGSCNNPLSDMVHKLVYSYGDTGPAGGTIIDLNYFNGSYYYTEIAPSGWYMGGEDPLVQWGGSGIIIGADGTELGTGEQNTCLIAEALEGVETGRAAQLCENYEVSRNGRTYDDWVLPSLEEGCFFNHEYIDNLFEEYYWTSSENGSDSAWCINTTRLHITHDWIGAQKTSEYRVRPVRFF